jgi:hypothetical protein
MYLRVVVGTTAMQVADKQSKLMQFAIAQKKNPEVVIQFAEWVKAGDMGYKGAQIVDLCKATDSDGNCEGFWLLAVGTQLQYEVIKKELSNSTVLDYWPIDHDKWYESLLDTLANDDDFAEDDTIPELKG